MNELIIKQSDQIDGIILILYLSEYQNERGFLKDCSIGELEDIRGRIDTLFYPIIYANIYNKV